MYVGIRGEAGSTLPADQRLPLELISNIAIEVNCVKKKVMTVDYCACLPVRVSKTLRPDNVEMAF